MGSSYSVRLMEEKDIPSAVALTDLMEWGLGEDDFSFIMSLEPQGCFVATERENLIGVTTSISFGHIGWVGNVIVAPGRRGSGVGANLVTEAVNYLEAEGVITTGLYAYVDVVSFYETLGFRVNRGFSWMVCKRVSWKGLSASSMERSGSEALFEFDERCFGAPRKRLLEAIFGSQGCVSRVVRDGSGPSAYVMASRSSSSAEIGPWVCELGMEEEAFGLLESLGDSLHGLEAHIGVPSDRTDLVCFLSGLGFAEEFPVVRMYHGPVPEERNCVLAMESLERG